MFQWLTRRVYILCQAFLLMMLVYFWFSTGRLPLRQHLIYIHHKGKTERIHPPLYFNNATAKLLYALLYFGPHPANKLPLKEDKISKATIKLTIKSVRQQKVQGFFVSYSLFYIALAYLSFFKSFISRHPVYGDIYDHPSKISFLNQSEGAQYIAALATQ